VKKLILGASLLVMASSVLAQDQPKHIISIGTDGFGWSGLGQVFEWDKDESGIKEHKYSEGSLKLNYSYVFESRFMLGFELSNETSKNEQEDTAGDKTTDETTTSEIGVSIGYNFNQDIYRSWWIKGALGSGKYKNETKEAGVKTDFEYGYTSFTISGGKRVSLESWGLKNLSYNPSIAITSAKISGDAEDAGLETARQVKLEIIKFDVLF
jgi:opacity protein-like surface antigen